MGRPGMVGEEPLVEELLDPMVVLTGMSGAGRSTTANVMEDLGWYVVDNLPPQMLPELAELHRQAANRAPGRPRRLAAVVDVRSRWLTDRFAGVLADLKQSGHRPTVVFLDATDEALVRRFESVRRPHPLQADGRLLDGIGTERGLMRELRSEADLIVDTSGLNVHQLSAKITSLFSTNRGPHVRMAVMSFGFKYGVPLDADFVFDLRFLPNPYWVPELRPHTGTEDAVRDYVMKQPGAANFLDRVVALIEPIADGYVREGRRYVTLALGCTGGKHRSVVIAEELCGLLRSDRLDTFVVHRDLGRE